MKTTHTTRLALLLVCCCFHGWSHAQLTVAKLAEVRKNVDGRLQRGWPDNLEADLLARTEKDRKELAVNLKDLFDHARESSLPAATCKWLKEYYDEMVRCGAALHSLRLGYDEANKYEQEMGEFGNDVLAELLNDAIDASKSRFRNAPADVKAVFEKMKSQAEDEFEKLARVKKKAIRHLAAANRWRPSVSEFSKMREAVRGMIERTVNRMVDARDHVLKDPAYRTVMKGDESNLCALCVRGRIEDARRVLKTWRPVRLKIADISHKLDRFPKEAGWIDVIVHGTPNKVQIPHNGKQYLVDSEFLFKLLNKRLDARHLSDWQTLHRDLGKGIRLISCRTGKLTSGMAQKLANRAGVKVKAPTETVYLVRYQGRLHVIIHRCQHCAVHKKNGSLGMHVLKTKQRGYWKTFTPNADASKEIRDRLYEKAKGEKWWQIEVTKVRLKRSKGETIKRLQRIHSRLSARKAEEMLTRTGKYLFIDRITRADGIDKVLDLADLGIQGRVQVMPRYKHEFRCVKID